ncbi:unnamed protein product [Ceutorhynchus assimilis]|uniref:OCIA domain-containing protein n=1 Tax=Ceutorhynchus assimilis TaxID=467358 RepID=A0A9N9ME06_9CUCU|nr:unnamed protein product [Ceutorhynchus assimilis]
MSSSSIVNPGGEQERTAPFPGPNARQRPQPYQFSSEEMRVLRECNKESFFGRSLPFSTILGGLTYYGIHTGLFKRSRSFGAVPKVTAAIITGYILGKFSYHQKCAEKFMALPDSKVGRMMKARRLGIPDDE